MIIIPFEPEHLELIELQESQKLFKERFKNEYASHLIDSGPCYSAIEDGIVYACAGVSIQWDNRAIVWSLLSKDVGRHFTRIHKAAFRLMDMVSIRRIEAHVDPDFPEAHRWIKMLGFEFEGRMKAFSPYGDDMDLYARIKNV